MIEAEPGYLDLLRSVARADAVYDRSVTSVFVHLPKTAGSTFGHFLLASFARPFEITWDDLDARVDALRAACRGGGVVPDLAYGHVGWDHIEQLAADPERYRLVTFVRDPVDRAISHYRYCCSPSHPHHERFRKNYPVIDTYIERGTKMWANHMTNAMVGGAASVDECIAKAEKLYAFVGATELYDLSLYAFCTAFGLPFEPATERVNAARDRAPDDVVVTDAHRAALAAGNTIDQGFYEHVVEEYRERAPELFQKIARQAFPRRERRRWLGRLRREA